MSETLGITIRTGDRRVAEQATRLRADEQRVRVLGAAYAVVSVDFDPARLDLYRVELIELPETSDGADH
jgi:hypothetical protein